mmetsp:Transcript_2442/g.5012  ORF Transcript_2442/g.5012 Transcript_2442/m.5012 type:complete len:354 (-) Transcript_2442:48-1109(-)
MGTADGVRENMAKMGLNPPASTAEERCELVTLTLPECYVYQVPPARTSAGHRAQDWNVEKWLQAVALRIVEQGDDCTVRLEDQTTGALFAACPIPNDKPLVTAVEPVIDSSRYFCLRIVDTTGAAGGGGSAPRHAFVGLGFSDRAHAYDFTATLQDHTRRMARQAEAERMREEASAQPDEEAAAAGEGQSESLSVRPRRDLSLKEGQSITINLKAANKGKGTPGKASSSSTGGGQPSPGLSAPPSNSSSISTSGGPGCLLSPPPPPPRLGQLTPPPCAIPAGVSVSGSCPIPAAPSPSASKPPVTTTMGVSPPEAPSPMYGGTSDAAEPPPISASGAAGVDDYDDDFGDFVSA